MRKMSIGQISDHELKQLRIFKTVTECGGFSASETELNISRPTISNHIAELEQRLNMTLCKRGRAGFSLTEEGQVIYEETCLLLDHMAKFRDIVNSLGQSPSGVLKIGLSDSVAIDERIQFPKLIDHFKSQAPDVTLNVSVETMSQLEKGVLNGDYDLGVIPLHRTLAGLNYLHLYKDRHNLYCAKNHSIFEMPSHKITEFIVNEHPLVHAGLNPHEEAYRHIYSMNRAAIAYHYETRMALTLSGQYIAFFPEHYAQPFVDAGSLKRLVPDQKSYDITMVLISKKTKQSNRLLSIFVNCIEKLLMLKP